MTPFCQVESLQSSLAVANVASDITPTWNDGGFHAVVPDSASATYAVSCVRGRRDDTPSPHERDAMSKTLDVVNAFPSMPDEALVSAEVVALLSGLSGRTVRRHPALPRRYVSADRYGYSVADVRRLLRGEAVPESERRVRTQPSRLGTFVPIGDAAMALVEKIGPNK
jgi:hypothetical protein